MALENFRTYQLSLHFYKEVSVLKMPYHLKDQMLRAASSICLNLSEGSAKGTPKDRAKFYRIALGSQRECATVLELLGGHMSTANHLCDRLGAHIYKLVHATKA